MSDYLAGLAPDRREAMAAVRKLILRRLPKGYVETMNWGMICYEVPLAIKPDTYNGKPLMYAALASQKNHMAIYLCALYCGNPNILKQFKAAWKPKTGKQLDMGAACVRFKRLDDLDLGAIGEVIASTPLKDFVKAAKR